MVFPGVSTLFSPPRSGIDAYTAYSSRLPLTLDWALIIIIQRMGQQAMTSFRKSFLWFLENLLFDVHAQRHRDFWKEVPYMLSDVVSHLCSTVHPRRTSSRGGYISV